MVGNEKGTLGMDSPLNASDCIDIYPLNIL